MEQHNRILYRRQKRNADRTVRVIPSLDCQAQCKFCSALMRDVPLENRQVSIPPEMWAEGINRRHREVIFTGGEPFMYPHFADLINMIEPDIRVQVYTNLMADTDAYLARVSRKMGFLVSLHPAVKDLPVWGAKAQRMLDAGNGLRFHIVKVGEWESLKAFLLDYGFEGRITVCDDQNKSIKCRGEEINKQYPAVRCTARIMQYGPDGYRYNCVKLMGLLSEYGCFEHISEPDGPDWMDVYDCPYLGYCAACSEMVEGFVEHVVDEKTKTPLWE